MRRALISAAAILLSTSALAQTPPPDLAKPPAHATHLVIQSTGGKHGDSWLWVEKDGTRVGRESMNLRGQVFELESRGKPGRDGMPVSVTIRGVTPQGDATETFTIAAGEARWQSPVDGGTSRDFAGRFYSTFGGPMEVNAWFVERLLASKTKSMKLLPGGEARASRLGTMIVGKGKTRKQIVLWQVTGVGTSPLPVWTDTRGKFFGLSFGIGWVPDAYVADMEAMQKVQTDALAAQMPLLAKQLVTVPTAPVAFTNVKLFDADRLQFLPDQTVVVSGGKIAAVGPAVSTPVPSGAQVIDGKGKSLVPGMWDCHMHVGNDYTLLQELSLGVTSVRDPGNDDKQTADRRARAAAGQLLSPNVYASSLIDGKGKYTAQVANVAASAEEAIAQVREAKAKGMVGVKFYGTIEPAWLPAAVAEAHKLGLHVHGHIPHGMRPSEAVKDGYDEITHINWIVMEGVPADVLPDSNGILRFEAPGRYAKDMDLDSPAMAGLIRTMAERKIYSDPTMVTFEGLYVPENGDLSPAYAAFSGTLPPSSERGFRAGGFAVPQGLTRADYRASWAKMVALLARMHKAGVPIVAGTDGAGIEIIRELEIYREAGLSPAEALAAATIVPARLVGQDARTGSIAVGKDADMVLIDGDPEARISDLRQTRTVMLGGKLMDADALRAAAGYSGRPKN